MKINTIASLLLAGLIIAACDDTTDTIGSSLSGLTDDINTETASFDVSSRTVIADSVLARNVTGYLGKVRDPETNAYVTGDFMTQFFCLENYRFPDLESLTYVDADGKAHRGVVRADSCEVRLFYSKFYGDSTRVMKMTAYEMGKAMNEDQNYYSSFDPMAKGYIRDNGIHVDKAYTLTDFNVPENTRDTSTYSPYLTIKLNGDYTDKEGRRFNNYGSYILQKFYDNADNFKNAYTFRNNVVPGFFFKHKSGLGSMAYIDASQLNVYYHYTQPVSSTTTVDGVTETVTKDSVFNGVTVFWGTEEVLQSTTITNDRNTLERLAADESCTYLKTPAGLFTELTLPVNEITKGHEHDNILSAKLSIQRINNTGNSDYSFDVPEYILMIPSDSINSFFEHSEMYNNRNSFVANWSNSSSSNAYVFNNISGMIATMAAVDQSKRSANWNKVVLIPVSLKKTSTSSTSSSSYYYYYYGSSSSSTSTVTGLSHNMALTSTKLVKGTSSDSPLKLDVIYSHFK